MIRSTGEPKHLDAAFIAYDLEESLTPGTRNNLFSISFSRKALSAEFRPDKVSAETDMLVSTQGRSGGGA